MHNKEFFIANTTVLGLFLFAVLLTYNVLSNEDFFVLIKNMMRKDIENVVTVPIKDVHSDVLDTQDTRCSKKERLSIDAGNDPHLKKLVEYQDLCQSYVTDTLMFFTGFPESRESSKDEAIQMAAKLKNFSKNGVHPIVVVEPYSGDELVDYKGFILNGNFKVSLRDYFKTLSENGITEEMMGTWIIFPESNTPNWENKDTEPKDFALCVNMYMGYMREYFPGIKGSILLNSATYDPNDLEWNNGDYLSLVPYLEDINKDFINSFGIQGFPWVSNATSEKTRQIFRASEFLQPDLAISSAQEIRTKDIWINTGTFASKYADDETKKVEVSLNDRKATLNGILEVAKGIEGYQLNEYRVSINLFSEDKSQLGEATDWSYFQNEDSKRLFIEFMRKAEENDIHVSLFDIEHR